MPKHQDEKLVEITSEGIITKKQVGGSKHSKSMGIIIGLLVVLSGSLILFLIVSGEARCELTNGDWKTFNSGCINSCTVESGKKKVGVQCFAEETKSCRCQKGDCWNGKYCEKIIYEEENE